MEADSRSAATEIEIIMVLLFSHRPDVSILFNGKTPRKCMVLGKRKSANYYSLNIYVYKYVYFYLKKYIKENIIYCYYYKILL